MCVRGVCVCVCEGCGGVHVCEGCGGVCMCVRGVGVCVCEGCVWVWVCVHACVTLAETIMS